MKVLTYDDLKPQKGISYSKVQIWRLEKQDKFPKRIQLGPGRHAWLDSEIDEWIVARAANATLGLREQ
jgi:prophage regulatory protein